MRAVFMGSAELSCPSLMALSDSPDIELAAVVSQPDRPKGRGRASLAVCPTKQIAEDRGIDVLDPVNINDSAVLERLAGYEPDIIVVVAYGQILRTSVLGIPRIGCVNLHASLLPLYRGAAPIQWAIANGDDVTGVTTMFMNEKMDEGDIISQQVVPIDADDTAATLHEKLSVVGAGLLTTTLRMLADGTAERRVQDESKVSLAPKLSKSDGLIDWGSSAETIGNRVRGFNPWPGCWTRYNAESGIMNSESGKVLKVWKAVQADSDIEPGNVVFSGEDMLLVGTGDKSLRLIEVQPEGGKIMDGAAYARGHLCRS